MWGEDVADMGEWEEENVDKLETELELFFSSLASIFESFLSDPWYLKVFLALPNPWNLPSFSSSP